MLTPLRQSLTTRELIALDDDRLAAVSLATHTRATVRRAELERAVRAAFDRAMGALR